MLTQKYQSVLDLGLKLNIKDGDVKEENGILKVKGVAATPYEKDLLWDEIKKVGGISPTDIEANITVENSSCYHTHHVVKGESLWALADKYYKNGNKHPIISEYNNTEHIHPGDVLKIPELRLYIDGEKLQVILTVLGYDTKGIDGKIGANTTTALKSFQAAKGLTASGKLDEPSKEALRQDFRVYTGALTGKAVQILLRDAGYSPGSIDGVLGAKTTAAITKFQSTNGLTANGQLDATTSKYLLNYYA